MAFVTQPSPVDNVRDLLFKLLQGFADGTYGTTAALQYLPHPSDTEWDVTRKMLAGFSDGSFTGTAHTAYAPAQGDNLYNLTRKLLQGFADGAFSTGTAVAALKAFSPGDSQWQLYRKLLQGFADGSFTGSVATPEKMPSPADLEWNLLEKLSLGFYLGTFSVSSACQHVPLAPTNLSVIGTTTSSITFGWAQPLGIPPAPAGSYIVSWGSTPGNHNLGSVTIPAAPLSYTITGLSPAQTVYVVVQAIGVDSCPGGTSAESAFTSDNSNGLLNGLISYWKFDVNVSPYADSVGGNPLTGVGTSAVDPGIINTGLNVGGGGSFASHVSNADFMPGAGVDLSISLWVSSSDWNTPPPGAAPNFCNKGDNVTLNSYNFRQVSASKNLSILLEDSSTAVGFVNLTAGAPTNNVYHHCVMVWDATAKLLSGYFDGVFKGSSALTTDTIVNGAQPFTIGAGAGFTSWAGLHVDETALWHKALTQTDVTNIFNGGACLPLSSYQT